MKAKFNYDLTEVISLFEKSRATSGLVPHHDWDADREALLQRAVSLVNQMEERAQQAALSQTHQLDQERVRRLLRKI